MFFPSSLFARIGVADANFFTKIFVVLLFNSHEYGPSPLLPYCFPNELLLIYNATSMTSVLHPVP